MSVSLRSISAILGGRARACQPESNCGAEITNKKSIKDPAKFDEMGERARLPLDARVAQGGDATNIVRRVHRVFLLRIRRTRAPSSLLFVAVDDDGTTWGTGDKNISLHCIVCLENLPTNLNGSLSFSFTRGGHARSSLQCSAVIRTLGKSVTMLMVINIMIPFGILLSADDDDCNIFHRENCTNRRAGLERSCAGSRWRNGSIIQTGK